MQSLIDSYTNTGSLHHAYAIAGSREAIKASIFLFLTDTLGIECSGNPDILDETYDTLGIDEARVLRGRQSKSAAVDSAKKIFILTATVITHEAQNALLKIFEEPTPDTHFFIIIPDAEILLPTLRSRLVVILHSNVENDMSFAKIFLQSDIAKRFAAIKNIIENKDRLAAAAFLDALEALLHASTDDAGKIAEHAFVFSEIANCRTYLRGRSPSLKLILEHLTLIIPCVT